MKNTPVMGQFFENTAQDKVNEQERTNSVYCKQL
jgi:hypothetical protein